jgi:hypothetical protein
MAEHAEARCVDDLDEQQLHLLLHIHRLPRTPAPEPKGQLELRLCRLRRFNTSITLRSSWCTHLLPSSCCYA